MLGIHETNEDWLTYTTASDTNFAQILADFNATINNLELISQHLSHVTKTKTVCLTALVATSYIKV